MLYSKVDERIKFIMVEELYNKNNIFKNLGDLEKISNKLELI